MRKVISVIERNAMMPKEQRIKEKRNRFLLDNGNGSGMLVVIKLAANKITLMIHCCPMTDLIEKAAIVILEPMIPVISLSVPVSRVFSADTPFCTRFP